jgi:hypothetical protein
MADRRDAPPPAPDRSDEKRGGAGPRAIAEMAARLTRRPLGKRGFAEAALVTEWSAVVGSMLGSATLPLRITFPRGERIGGTLHIRAASGAVATQLQHQEPLVVQRINGYFGYGAVLRLAINQGPVPARPVRKSPPVPRLEPERERDLQDKLAGIDDPELKSALASLGRHLAARR